MNQNLLVSISLAFLLSISSASEKTSAWIEIELNDGQTFSGEPVSYRNHVVSIRTIVDGGAFDRGFPADSIASLRFPDEKTVAHARDLIDGEITEETLSVLEKIWLPRAPFLSLLDEETIGLLAHLPGAQLALGDPYRAVGLAQRLLPHAAETESADRIHEVILLGYLKLELWEEAEERAKEWIDEQPRFSQSALGWRVLAELALRNQELEELLWIALQPIAMTGAENIDHLADCYALAIHALFLQEETSRAVELFKEMRERGLNWPKHEKLQETKNEMAELVPVTSNAEDPDAEAEVDLDLRPPEKDLNLPIDHVRKAIKRP